MAKHVLFALAVTPPALLILALLLFFQPRDQVVVTRHENGYLATRSRQVMGPAGRPIHHGEHEAWYISGNRAAHGHYREGERSGEWRFWTETGELDRERSGVYEAGERVSGLPD